MLETKRSREKFIFRVFGVSALLLWGIGLVWAWEAKDQRGWLGVMPNEAIYAWSLILVTGALIASLVLCVIIAIIATWVERGDSE